MLMNLHRSHLCILEYGSRHLSALCLLFSKTTVSCSNFEKLGTKYSTSLTQLSTTKLKTELRNMYNMEPM
jgi:hypothetical protein